MYENTDYDLSLSDEERYESGDSSSRLDWECYVLIGECSLPASGWKEEYESQRDTFTASSLVRNSHGDDAQSDTHSVDEEPWHPFSHDFFDDQSSITSDVDDDVDMEVPPAPDEVICLGAVRLRSLCSS